MRDRSEDTWLASAAGGELRIWNIAVNMGRSGLHDFPRQVHLVAIASHGHNAAFLINDGSILVVDTATGSTRKLGSALFAGALAASPDGVWIAAAEFGIIRIWNLTTGAEDVVVGDTTIKGIAFGPDSVLFASVDAAGLVRVHDLISGALVALMRVDGSLRGCAWLPDGAGLALAGQGGLYVFDLQR